MKRSRAIPIGPLFLSLAGIAFCIWIALGNDVNFCVTTGCVLYQDFTIAGISLWWLGTGAFSALAACALLGLTGPGRALAALFLAGDALLLMLMAFTAPCVSCLAVAILFALVYFFWLRAADQTQKTGAQVARRRSVLLLCWFIFFVINAGQVARSLADTWAMLDESGDPRVKVFFSPSCPICVEGINALSGNVNAAFYPVAENDEDVARIAGMSGFLAQGMNIAEALGQSREVEQPGFFTSFSPEMILLRFRLLRNKAYLFGSGSQGVPYFEYRGLPPDVLEKARERLRRSSLTDANPQGNGFSASQRDASLPVELDGGQCTGSEPCPPAQ